MDNRIWDFWQIQWYQRFELDNISFNMIWIWIIMFFNLLPSPFHSWQWECRRLCFVPAESKSFLLGYQTDCKYSTWYVWFHNRYIAYFHTSPVDEENLHTHAAGVRKTNILITWMKKTYILMLRVSGKLTYSYYGWWKLTYPCCGCQEN